MLFSTAIFIASLAAVAHAHFQLQFPTPRGPFTEDDEPNFCDGFNNAGANRTTFPLSGGFVTLHSEHPSWTLGILVSTAQNPSSFNDFSSQLARAFAKTTGEGDFCVPLDFSSSNITGIKDGANITIQLEYDGGDSPLFQCADLTLSSNFTIPSSITCSNATGSSSPSSGSPSSTAPVTGSTSPSGSTTTPPSPTANAAVSQGVVAGSLILGVLATLLTIA